MSSVSLISSTIASPASSSAAITPLPNRPAGTRNPGASDGTVPPIKSTVDQDIPFVPRTAGAASSGDMLETLPDADLKRKAKQSDKPINVPIFPVRIEIRFRSDVPKDSLYCVENPENPLLDIRV